MQYFNQIIFIFFRETSPEEKKDEEASQMTYDEWKKQQEENRSKPQFNLRKVDNEKKGMKQLKKPTEEENEADGSLFFPKKVLIFFKRFFTNCKLKKDQKEKKQFIYTMFLKSNLC